jgi:hypothetical protein
MKCRFKTNSHCIRNGKYNTNIISYIDVDYNEGDDINKLVEDKLIWSDGLRQDLLNKDNDDYFVVKTKVTGSIAI